VYLCNDLLHHSVRLHAIHILSSLHELLVPLCHAACKNAPEGLRQKVEATILIWEVDQLIRESLLTSIRHTYLRRDQPKPFAWKESSTNRGLNAAAKAPAGLQRQDVHQQASRLAAVAAAGGGLGLGEKIEGGSGPAYFEQPAGLMVPVVKAADTLYAPLVPGELRRPADEQTSQVLKDAFKAFINPTVDRNAEGWEAGGLDAHYKRKRDALQDQNPFSDNADNGGSLSSVSVGGGSGGGGGGGRSSRSPSPEETRGLGLGLGGHGGGLGSSSAKRRVARSSRSRSPAMFVAAAATRERSPSPESVRPSFGGGGKQTMDTHLTQSNIGFKMMMKQGWQKGKGLGASESGLQEPIRPAGVREKSSMYKGIGVPAPDVYEQYRNQKSRNMYDNINNRKQSK